MKTISTYLIVKNEESVIKRCIDSIIPFSDEIIITDTGSTDKTKEIIRGLNCQKIKLYDFEWCDDFSKARNFSLNKTTSDYVLTTDADEIFEKSLQDEIIYLKENDFFDFTKLYIPLTNFDENGNEIDTICYDSRSIINKNANPFWINPVHEHLRTTEKNYSYTTLKNGRILHKKHGGATSQYTKYKEIFLKSLIDYNQLKTVDVDYLNYFYLTLLWDDIPLCKKILSKTFSYYYIKDNNDDIRAQNIYTGRLTDYELLAMIMINDPYATSDPLKIKLLYDITTIKNENDTAEYLILEFFKENRENELFKPYLKNVYEKLYKKELQYNFPRDYIQTSELLYKLDNSTQENFTIASNLKEFMANTNIIIKSSNFNYSLIYYASRYFDNIFVIDENDKNNIPSFCKKYKSINDAINNENKFSKTLVISSEQQIFTEEFRRIYDDFLKYKNKIFYITK